MKTSELFSQAERDLITRGLMLVFMQLSEFARDQRHTPESATLVEKDRDAAMALWKRIEKEEEDITAEHETGNHAAWAHEGGIAGCRICEPEEA